METLIPTFTFQRKSNSAKAHPGVLIPDPASPTGTAPSNPDYPKWDTQQCQDPNAIQAPTVGFIKPTQLSTVINQTGWNTIGRVRVKIAVPKGKPPPAHHKEHWTLIHYSLIKPVSQKVLPALLEVRITNLRSRIDQQKPGKKKRNFKSPLHLGLPIVMSGSPALCGSNSNHQCCCTGLWQIPFLILAENTALNVHVSTKKLIKGGMCVLHAKTSINLGSAAHGPLRRGCFGSDFTSGCTNSWTPEASQAGHDNGPPEANFEL